MRWQGSLSAIVLLSVSGGVALAQAPYQQSNYQPNWTMPALDPAWPDQQVEQRQSSQPARYTNSQYPNQQNSNPQYSSQQYATQQYPTQQYPAQQAQPQQFPAQQYPAQQAQPQQYPQPQFANTRNGNAQYADPQFSSPQANGYPQQAPIGTNYPNASNNRGTYRPVNQYTRQDNAPQSIQETLPYAQAEPRLQQQPTPAQDYSTTEQLGQGYLQDQNNYADGSVDFTYCEPNASVNVGAGGAGFGTGGAGFGVASGFLFSFETLFFKYLRSDGVRYGTSGNQEVVEFDMSIAPRMTFGYLPACGPGFRLRWFDFEDHAIGSVAGQGLGVDTVVIDLEMFRPYQVNPYWVLEVSGGLRFASFREIMADGSAPELRINDIDAFGGVFGVQSNHRFCFGSLYGRARFAVLSGDKFHRNDNTPIVLSLNDTVVGMTEVGFGYEIQHCFVGRRDCRSRTVFGRIGAEWQHWHNFSTEFVNIAPSGEDSGGPSDVGFMGILLEAGIYF